MKTSTLSFRKYTLICCMLLVTTLSFSQTSYVEVFVDWPAYSSENRVEIYNPSNTLISTIDNGFTGGTNNSYTTTVSLGCIPDGNNYYFIMYDTANDGWDGADNISIYSGGVTVINQDGNAASSAGAAAVFFDVNGGCSGTCDTTVSSFPYNEGFESGLGDWVQDTGDDNNWSRRSGTTPSGTTGPSGANEGTWYMYTEASNPNYNDTFNLISPCFDLSSETSANFSFFYHMFGSSMGDLFLEISTDNGLSYPTILWSQTAGEVQNSSAQAWNEEIINLMTYVGQTIKLRFRGETIGSWSGDMAIDNVSLTATSVSGPEINVQGNAVTIDDNETATDVGNNTDFGSVNTIASNNPNTFTIQNTGTTALSVGAITIGGDDPGDFTVTTTPAASVAALGSTTFVITFDPSAVGPRNASVSIVNGDSDENPYNFNITGNGFTPLPEINIQGNAANIADDPSITPDFSNDTDFGTIDIAGGTNLNTFTIQNIGTSTLTVGAITIGGTHPGDFTLTTSPASSIAGSGNTTFSITFNPSAIGLRSANVTIINGDADENPYNFNIHGTGFVPPPCGSYVIHNATFESSLDGWTDGGANANRQSNATWAYGGNYSLRISSNDLTGNTSSFISPTFNTSIYDKVDFKFFFKAQDMDNGDNFFIEYSDDDGASWTVIADFIGGSVVGKTADFEATATAISYSKTATIFATDYTFSSNSKFRVRCDADDIADRIYIDDITISGTSFCTPTQGPGGVISDLDLWLKADQLDGITFGTDGGLVNNWIDNGKGNNAETVVTGQEPVYRNNIARNFNFNPVIDFENDNTTANSDMTYIINDGSRDELKGTGGFNSNDMFIVLMPDPLITTSMIPLDTFTSDDPLVDSFAEDVTGFGYGAYTARFDNERLSYCIGTTSETAPSDPVDNGYGRGDLSTGTDYNKIQIINIRQNAIDTDMELYYNANQVGTATNDIGLYTTINNGRYWLGRSQYWNGSFDGRIAEVITYGSRKTDVDLTEERNRVQSYLAIKYGITLGVNGTTQDYVNSDGNVIWDVDTGVPANDVYNYDIAGIGRDDASELNQKQSRSINDDYDGADPVASRTQGILTMGLNDIYDTNRDHISTNSTTFGDKEFLVWGNNGADLTLAASMVSVNMSAGVSPALTTDVSFVAMQRVWKVEETGGDIPSVKVRIPQAAIRNITPPGSFYMFISSTGVFDPTADYRIMTADGSGNLETDYDFDGVKYITFGYAPRIEVERSVYFDGSVDYIDMEDALDLNPAGFTISAWIKRDAVDSGTKSIVSKRNLAFTTGYDFRILNSNRINISWKNPGSRTLTGSTAIPNDEWHHVAAIYDGTTVRLYIDGVEDGSVNVSAPVDSDDSFFIAAAAKTAPERHFRGNIDEVRVWDTNLTSTQLRFIMNQEIEENSSFVEGKILPNTITRNDVATIPWSQLAGYYPMSVYTYTNTEDASGNGNQGALRNLNTVDRQTAPLPYATQAGGDWSNNNTWLNGNIQAIPNELSVIDGLTPIDWNIVRVGHNVTIDTEVVLGRERQVLALYVDAGELTVDGDNADAAAGNGLTVSHYLKLDGKIDLEGQSQLVQGVGSDLDPTSSGSIEKDQQGTADLHTYNYWSSPVGETNATTNNNSYSVTDVMYDGVNPINFINSGYDGSDGGTITIADFWIWKFANQPDDDYSAWQHVRRNGTLLAGEGFTMKGPGSGTIVDQQNYVFQGKPNNGDINLTLNAGNDYLVGNPYPSAINANTFITDNGPNITGAGANPLISGTLYFWEHWGGGSHNLQDYQGGYATYNFSGGVAAPSLGSNDPDVGTGGTPTKTPGLYIPVSQGFFVVGETTGNINFNNGQREFKKEKFSGADSSVFVRSSDASASTSDDNEAIDERMKFRIGFNSVNTIHRQLLLTIDDATTTGYDWAYDAKIYDDQMDDLYWVIENDKYTIQGSNEAEPESVYPLGIKTDEDGLNTITIDGLENVPDSMGIFIHDLENDTYHDLRAEDFEFVLPAGEHLDRFELTFDDPNADALGVDDTKLNTIDAFFNIETESIALYNPNFVNVKSIELYNIIGQQVTKIENISELDYSEYRVKNLSTGTYILKIDTLSGLLSKKVLVK
jgi:hypothetical protein